MPSATARVEEPGFLSPPLHDLTDEQLMALVKRSDQEAFTCLLRRHLDPVHGYLSRFTGSTADADDISQETFLRVWQKAHTFKPGQVKFTTWLHRIAHNLSIDEFRKRRINEETEKSDIADENSDQFLQHQYRDTRDRLIQAIGKLPETQRSALVLCRVQGFSNQEAANVLNVSLHALESLLSRARRSLKTTLFQGQALQGESNEQPR